MHYSENMKKLLGYTREPIDNVYYDARLAYSLHLAVGADGDAASLPSIITLAFFLPRQLKMLMEA